MEVEKLLNFTRQLNYTLVVHETNNSTEEGDKTINLLSDNKGSLRRFLTKPVRALHRASRTSCTHMTSPKCAVFVTVRCNVHDDSEDEVLGMKRNDE